MTFSPVGKDTEDTIQNEELEPAVRILSSDGVTSEDPLTRKHSLFLLGTTGDPSYSAILIRSLYDPEKGVRSQAALALARIGDPVVPDVIDLLRDRNWKVRYRAAEVLGLIRSREALRPLVETLSDEKDHVRYMAAKSLGMIKDPAALQPLRKCVSDPNPFVRKIVAESIHALERVEIAG